MALYHKYRPQLFSSIVDQKVVVTTLQNQLKLDKNSHAYLFCGPRGIGKTTTARVLAKALNCENRRPGESEPCGRCASCQEVTAGRAIDVMEMDAASHTGVDNVRENIIDNANFRPTRAKYKIFVIDEVHMLSTAAFNALLKTLEEPPSHVVFILATTESHKVPATIVSRCQQFTFKKVPSKILKKHLATVAKDEGASVDEEVLERVARKSEGCVRDAVGLLEQLLSLGVKKITLDEAELIVPTTSLLDQIHYLDALINERVADGLHLLDELSKKGAHLPEFGKDLIELLRLAIISRVDAGLARDELDLPPDQARDFLALLSAVSATELVALTDKAQERVAQIPSSPAPQLPLELLLVEWSGRRGQNSPNRNETAAKSDGQTGETKKTAADAASDRADDNPAHNQNTAGTPPKRTFTEKVRELVHNRQIPIETVEKAWPIFLASLEARSPSLLMLLKMASVAGFEHGAVKVRVSHPFHLDKLNEKNCKKILEERLADVIGEKIKLEFALANETEAPVGAAQPAAAGDLRELAAALGGEVIQ